MAVVETTKPTAPLINNPNVRGIAYQAVLCALIAYEAIHFAEARNRIRHAGG